MNRTVWTMIDHSRGRVGGALPQQNRTARAATLAAGAVLSLVLLVVLIPLVVLFVVLFAVFWVVGRVRGAFAGSREGAGRRNVRVVDRGD